VQRAAYRVEAELIEFNRIPPLHETADDISGLDLTMLGAVESAELVAIAGYRREGEFVDIDRLAVHPSWFRCGIATLLITEIHRREVDAQRFDVSTAARNGPAVKLYTTMGYRRLADEAISTNLLIAHFVRP
jgi:ribosomal protein S18 acetylase RimI-like enzyme